MIKKAQITIFIILAIIISFLVIFMIFLNQNIQGKKSKQNFEILNQLAEDKKIVENYLKDCFEDAVKINLMEIGLQGGWFYKSQLHEGFGDGGPNIGEKYGEKYVPFWYNSSISDTNIYNLSYALKPRKELFLAEDVYRYGLNKPLYIPIGSYPFGDFSQNTAGQYTSGLPALCLGDGANKAAMEGSEFSCPSYGSNNKRTIQYFLNHKILKDTITCFEKQSFYPKINAYLEIVDKQNSNAETMFGESTVNVNLKLPVRVTFNYPNLNEKPVYNENEFSVVLPIRFKYIFELMMKILEQETKNIFFNLNNIGIDNKSMHFCEDFIKTEEADKIIVDCFRDGMTFEIIKNACEYSINKSGIDLPCNKDANKSTFLIVRDKKSLNFINQPFEFVTVIGNRAPIIDLINFEKFNGTDEYSIYLKENYDLFENNLETTPNNVYNRTRSPIINNNDEFDIILDWDEVLYIIPRAIDPDEDFDYKNLTIMEKKYEYSGWNKTLLKNSSFYKFGAHEKAIEHNMINKDVNLSLNMSHVGEHQINVTVYDASDNIFTRTVNLQVRCFDQLRGFDNNTVKQIHLTGRWVDGNFESGDTDIWGDYNFSALSYDNLDLNDTNDCCNESGGFVFSDDEHKCDTCMRCVNGNCLVNVSAGNTANDCGFCHSCGVDGSCMINDSHNFTCENQYSGNGVCCNGNCLDSSSPTPLHSFTWTYPALYNGTKNKDDFAECWTTSPTCIKLSDVNGYYDNLAGNYTYKPLSGELCVNSDGDTVLCSKGRCD
jgi:hypothetical protein